MTFKTFSIALAALVSASAAHAQVEPGKLALHAAAQPAQQFNHIFVLDGHSNPIVDQRTPSRISQRGPGGEAPALTVWNDRIALVPGETAVLHAQLDWLNAESAQWDRLRHAGSALAVTGSVQDAQGSPLGIASYNDAGEGADAVAGDGIYTAQWRMPASATPAIGHAHSVMVQVRAESAQGLVRHATGGLLLSQPAAVLTGDVQRTLIDGVLHMQAKANVLAPGRVHLSAVLATPTGAPLLAVQHAEVLNPGEHWLNIALPASALAGVGLTGPINVQTLTLRSTNGMPNALGPVLHNVGTLPPATASDLLAVR